MRTSKRAIVVLSAAALAVAGVILPSSAAAVTKAGPVCGPVRVGFARCLSMYDSGVAVRALADPSAAPDGVGADDLESAYKLPVDDPSDTLVAVSIAFDAPNLEQDLNIYRAQYGLGPCTVASGCLTKVNQQGHASPLPSVDPNWEVEETLDVSMISAACPHCRILVVEGNLNDDVDLAATEDTAVALGAQVVSNSYTTDVESGADAVDAPSYQHPGHTIVVSSGDAGFGPAGFPATLDSVTAVGGTVLDRADNARGWTESAWQESSSGCSAYQPKPPWQQDSNCGMRTVADVSAAADQIAIYNSDQGGWFTVSGTSASAPLVAGIYGLAGNATTIAPGYEYAHSGALFDVTTGTNDLSSENGGACGHDYLCEAKAGFDGPTGLGTPNGVGAF